MSVFYYQLPTFALILPMRFSTALLAAEKPNLHAVADMFITKCCLTTLTTLTTCPRPSCSPASPPSVNLAAASAASRLSCPAASPAPMPCRDAASRCRPRLCGQCRVARRPQRVRYDLARRVLAQTIRGRSGAPALGALVVWMVWAAVHVLLVGRGGPAARHKGCEHGTALAPAHDALVAADEQLSRHPAVGNGLIAVCAPFQYASSFHRLPCIDASTVRWQRRDRTAHHSSG